MLPDRAAGVVQRRWIDRCAVRCCATVWYFGFGSICRRWIVERFQQASKAFRCPVITGSPAGCAGFPCCFDQTKCNLCYVFFYSFLCVALSEHRSPAPLILALS